MATYNTSSAYDLSRFERPKKKETAAPNLRVVKPRKKSPASVLGPGVVLAFFIVVALVTLMIYNQVQLNELTEEINQLSHEMEVLQSKNVQMTSSLESTLSNIEVGKLAREMGMQPRTEYQTERIYLYQQDKIERTPAASQETASDSAKLAVSSFFGFFKEYMDGR